MGKIKKTIAFLIALLPLFTSSAIPVFASATYSYDANGNLTSDGVNCYTYNDANQVSQVKNCVSNQVVAQYVYDYQGNRLVKKNYVSGTLNNTVYSPNDGYETKKLSNGSTQNTSYYYVNDELVAKKNPDGTKNYYLSDNLHSTSILASQSGSVIESSSYYPFGAIRTGGTQGKYLYTGQQNDQETGLDYYNARYYSPQIRHFTQPDNVIADPYNPQNLNRYAYVNNNPLTHNDPSGNCPVCVPFITGGLGLVAGVGMQFLSNPHSSWQDYGKAAGIGFAAGFAAPVIEGEVAGVAAVTLARTAIPVVARTVISDTIGTAASSLSINATRNMLSGEDPAKGLAPQLGIDIVANYITDGIIPMQGRTPSLLNPVKLGTNSLKQIGREELSNTFGDLLNNMGNYSGVLESLSKWPKGDRVAA